MPKDLNPGRRLFHVGRRVAVNIIDRSGIRGAIEEFREIQLRFQTQLDRSGEQEFR